MLTTHEFLAELSKLSSEEEKLSRPITREPSEPIVAARPVSDNHKEELLSKIEMLQDRIEKLEVLYLKLSDLRVASTNADIASIAASMPEPAHSRIESQVEDKLPPVDVLSKYGKVDEDEPMPATDDPAHPDYMPNWTNTKEGE